MNAASDAMDGYLLTEMFFQKGNNGIMFFPEMAADDIQMLFPGIGFQIVRQRFFHKLRQRGGNAGEAFFQVKGEIFRHNEI